MDRQAFIVVGLGYGDEGKGSITDFLARKFQAHTVVRYNGGAQAAHNVVTPDGRHHTFAQFGSATFVPGVRTHLSRFMLLNPLNLLTEEWHLRQLRITDALQRLSIDADAPIITPFQVAMNRLRERARGNGRHGSCGMGIGETMADLLIYSDLMPRARDLVHTETLALKLQFLQMQKAAEAKILFPRLPSDEVVRREMWLLRDPNAVSLCLKHYTGFARQVQVVERYYLDQILAEPGAVIFEGAQGVLLDEWRGFHPYTTWTTTTTANAQTLLDEADYAGEVTKIGLVRAYSSRHGAGPFVTEEKSLAKVIPDQHNSSLSVWQGEFRVGAFDEVAIRYALEVTGGVDYLAVSHLDRLASFPDKRRCVGYHVSSRMAAEQFCQFDDQGHIIRLKPGPLHDLEYQSQLTDLLFTCQPVYTNGNRDEMSDTTEYLAQLEETLGVPIGITSGGPTATDKNLIRQPLAVRV